MLQLSYYLNILVIYLCFIPNKKSLIYEVEIPVFKRIGLWLDANRMAYLLLFCFDRVVGGVWQNAFSIKQIYKKRKVIIANEFRDFTYWK